LRLRRNGKIKVAMLLAMPTEQLDNAAQIAAHPRELAPATWAINPREVFSVLLLLAHFLTLPITARCGELNSHWFTSRLITMRSISACSRLSRVSDNRHYVTPALPFSLSFCKKPLVELSSPGRNHNILRFGRLVNLRSPDSYIDRIVISPASLIRLWKPGVGFALFRSITLVSCSIFACD
jgi:hypothetical protein